MKEQEQLRNCTKLISYLTRIQDEDYDHSTADPAGPCCAYGHAYKAGILPISEGNGAWTPEEVFGPDSWANIFSAVDLEADELSIRNWSRADAIAALQRQCLRLRIRILEDQIDNCQTLLEYLEQNVRAKDYGHESYRACALTHAFRAGLIEHDPRLAGTYYNPGTGESPHVLEAQEKFGENCFYAIFATQAVLRGEKETNYPAPWLQLRRTKANIRKHIRNLYRVRKNHLHDLAQAESAYRATLI